MRYFYGTEFSIGNGKSVSAKQLASIIKKDVEYGKWNKYQGGDAEKETAKCEYSSKGFTHYQQMKIYGSEKEFKQLEQLIKDFIEVIPRKFN